MRVCEITLKQTTPRGSLEVRRLGELSIADVGALASSLPPRAPASLSLPHDATRHIISRHQLPLPLQFHATSTNTAS